MATVFRGFDQAALDREYDARASVPDFAAEMARYEALSAAARNKLPPVPHVFDPPSGNMLDWFAGRPGSPVFLWVHGGYWRALSRMEQSCVAPGLVAAGVGVAVMDYTLVPYATLDEIVRQVRAACAWVTARAEGPVFIGGSSAGGHLCGMVLAEGSDVRGAVLLSGLYDLEPVRLSHVNAWMQLDEAAARRNSPLRHIPPALHARLLLSYGEHETAEFKRQTHEYAAAWSAAGGQARVLPAPGHNHFSVAAALGDRADPLCQAAIAFMQEG